MDKPIFLRSKSEVTSLLKKNKHIIYVDAFSLQIKELFIIQNTEYAGNRKEEGYKTKKFDDFVKKTKNIFIYVYYPWNYTIVKTVKKNEYLELKTNRNQDLITKAEQKKLSNCRVAVLGMSVGSNIALVLTQAGISNDIAIADFDELDTTNLNRIIAGSHQIGLNKCIIASRHIYEDNPFANITTLQKGVTKISLEKLLKSKKIDIIVEEVDNLPIKIYTRELAIKYKVPVIMITDNGDGVVLHVERYDLGYNKIFNKNIIYWKDIISKPPSMDMMGKIIINDIVGGEKNVDPKMLKSVEKVFQKKLVSWSQLGSAAILGGVVTTVIIKKIINNESKEKYIVKNIFVL